MTDIDTSWQVDLRTFKTFLIFTVNVEQGQLLQTTKQITLTAYEDNYK